MLTSVDITGKWSWPVGAVVISKKLLTCKLVRHEGSRVGGVILCKNLLDDRSKWSWSSTSKHCTHWSRSCPCMHACTHRATKHCAQWHKPGSQKSIAPWTSTPSLRVDWPSFTCWIPQWLRWSTTACMASSRLAKFFFYFHSRAHTPPASTTPTNKNLAF